MEPENVHGKCAHGPRGSAHSFSASAEAEPVMNRPICPAKKYCLLFRVVVPDILIRKDFCLAMLVLMGCSGCGARCLTRNHHSTVRPDKDRGWRGTTGQWATDSPMLKNGPEKRRGFPPFSSASMLDKKIQRCTEYTSTCWSVSLMTGQHDAVALWKSSPRGRLHRARTAARGPALRSVGAIPR
jgi:hypothetical protein